MMLLASFVTVNFHEWKPSWPGSPRPPEAGLPHGERRRANQGVLAGFDLGSGAIVFARALDTPSGFSVAQDVLYVNSMYGNRVVVLDADLEVAGTLSLPLFSDLHSIRADPSGLLITSSGTDAILEVSLAGDVTWSWLATEHGYCSAPDGPARRTDRHADYRSRPIETTRQATHCNSAVAATIGGRDAIVATLFHQGEVIAIDRATGAPRTVLEGLQHPHSIRPHPGGWLVSDSRTCTVRILDHAFQHVHLVAAGFNWVQDAIMTPWNSVLVADANNTRIAECHPANGRLRRSISYPANWKIFQIEIANPEWERRLRRRADRLRISRDLPPEPDYGHD